MKYRNCRHIIGYRDYKNQSAFLPYFYIMLYRVLGIMSGSSMDGLDMVYCLIEENAGEWSYQIEHGECMAFDPEWKNRLEDITRLSALELIRTHSALGRWIGYQANEFMERYGLEHKVHFISSHGHTVFHEPHHQMTFQIGDGAGISVITGLPVISDLRNIDVALGGQGAPIVPIGEKLFWKDFNYFLNIGGIANLTKTDTKDYMAYDVCPANRVLNELAKEKHLEYDQGGAIASEGNINLPLLEALNNLEYYTQKPPKSLANEMGTQKIIPLIGTYNLSTEDKMRTYVEHICVQISQQCEDSGRMLVTGGGAFNGFLIQILREKLKQREIEIIIPDKTLIEFKEALVMALIGVLRWREESNVLNSVTGSSRNSIGGALWLSQ